MRHSFTSSGYATVTNNDDPDKLGRIKVRCGLLMDGDKEIPLWIAPRFMGAGPNWGEFYIPRVGDTVEIEWSTGHTSDPVPGLAAMNPNIQYRSALYTRAEDIPAEFSGDHYKKRFGHKMHSGGSLIYDEEHDAMALSATNVRLGHTEAADGQPAVVGNTLKGWEEDLLTTIANALTDVLALLSSASLGGLVGSAGPVTAAAGADALVWTNALTTIQSAIEDLENELRTRIPEHLSDHVTIAKSKPS
jgi:hypothetical protein